MREIKFRAWHMKQKRMFSAYEMGEDQLTLSVDGRGFVNIDSVHKGLSKFSDNTMIPLQFTGFHDKNGKEIYEGDILVYKKAHYTRSGNPTGKFMNHYWGVFFEERAGQWRMKRGEEIQSLWNKIDAHEVIGNVWENPELLNTV